MTGFVDPEELQRQLESGALPSGAVVTFTVRYQGLGRWGVGVLAEAHARELARKGFVAGVRINDGPEIT